MDKIRKEVALLEGVIPPLQKEADKKGWPLKKLMEYILTKESSRLFGKQSNLPKK